jgi:putative membrane protein
MIAACLLLAGPALAQSVGEKTGVNSALGIAPSTADFVKEAASAGMFEIESSKLAEQKDQGPVKDFAEHMVTDHTKAADELKDKAQKAGVTVPTGMSNSQQSKLDKLRGLNGKDFDKQYVDDQVSAHKETVSLFERYGKSGDNQQLKAWATQTLPTLQHHLDMAQNLNK